MQPRLCRSGSACENCCNTATCDLVQRTRLCRQQFRIGTDWHLSEIAMLSPRQSILGMRLSELRGDIHLCLRLTVIKIPRNICGEHELLDVVNAKDLPLRKVGGGGSRERPLSKAMTSKRPAMCPETEEFHSGAPPLMGEAVPCVRSMLAAPKWTTGATTTKQSDCAQRHRNTPQVVCREHFAGKCLDLLSISML